jgi:hypothetical protein
MHLCINVSFIFVAMPLYGAKFSHAGAQFDLVMLQWQQQDNAPKPENLNMLPARLA